MLVTRSNQKIIFKSFESSYISALLGPRRVGKSTLTQAFVSLFPEKNWVMLNMDVRAERLRIEAEQLEALLIERGRKQISPESPLWIAIDEAQKCPALFEQIKVLYDRFKGTPALKFILTGSGFLSLHQLAAETLAGRIELHHLREFNLREALALKEQKNEEGRPSLLDALFRSSDIPALEEIHSQTLPDRIPLQERLREQLIWGGLPEVLQTEDTEGRIAYLGNYLQTYLEKDVRDIPTVSDLGLYQRMMEIIAQQTGSVREDKRIVDALGCSRDTLKKYRGYLEATLVYRELFPFIGSSLKRLVKSPKGYITNNGLLSYLTGIYDLNALEKTGAVGHRFENWALREIQISLDRDPRQSEIYYWRTSGNVEVDLVVQKQPRVFPFEVTYSSQKDPRKVKHLQQFLRAEKSAERGFYIYNGEWKWDAESRVLFLPSWALG
ncbi:MAG TPA: AAA family ATPase [bacterium]|nr:AAA family ATPase [bacterium]